MATLSVQKDPQGPDWPLGLIVVASAGTPVGIMSLVDPTNVGSPATATPGTSGAPEYTPRAQQIIFQGVKAGASNGLQNNTGNIYICRKGVGGAGNHNDYGSIVATLAAGQTLVLGSAPLNRNVYSPYRYYIDADNSGDSCLVTLIMQ
jgi:hypothetical protein